MTSFFFFGTIYYFHAIYVSTFLTLPVRLFTTAFKTFAKICFNSVIANIINLIPQWRKFCKNVILTLPQLKQWDSCFTDRYLHVYWYMPDRAISTGFDYTVPVRPTVQFCMFKLRLSLNLYLKYLLKHLNLYHGPFHIVDRSIFLFWDFLFLCFYIHRQNTFVSLDRRLVLL